MLALFVVHLSFLLDFSCNLHGQLCIAGVILTWDVSVAQAALRALPCEGLFQSTVLLILMVVPHIMGVLHTLMLLA